MGGTSSFASFCSIPYRPFARKSRQGTRGIIHRNVFHQDNSSNSAVISHQGLLPPPPPSVFSANLSLPSSHESVSGPRLLFLALSRRALTRETRRGWPSPLLPSSLWIYTRPSRHGQQWEFRKPCRRREFKLARTTMTVVRGRGINDILLWLSTDPPTESIISE